MSSDQCKENRMWNVIKINNNHYLVSVTQKNNTIKVFLTNLIELWLETLTNEAILNRCKELNPLLSVEALNHTKIILDALNNISDHIITEASEECIKLRAPVEGGTMKFVLNFSKGTPQDFWEIITKPLCTSSMEMTRQHKFLIDLVKKKDEEIAEYKAEGAELVRKNIETKPFIEEQFKTDIVRPGTIDCTSAFRRMLDFYSDLTLRKENETCTVFVSCNSRFDDVQKIEQNVNIVYNDEENVHRNEDICTQQNTDSIILENKREHRSATNKKASMNKTGTANIEYKPVKKLKKVTAKMSLRKNTTERRRKISVEEPEHLPEKLPRRQNHRIKRKRCRQCTANGLRKETNYFCTGCKDNPGLCLGQCFKEYHNLV